MEISQIRSAHTNSFGNNPNNHATLAPSYSPTKNPAAIPPQQQQEKKTGPIQRTKNFISGFKKAWIYVSEYTIGTLSGAIKGGILGGLTYAGIYGKNAINLKTLKNAAPKKLGEVVSAAVGLLTLGHSLFKASLNVSERTAKVDHRYNTGHRAE